MKQKIKIQSVFKYLFLFCYFFYCLVLAYNLIRGDSYVNFGFSYAITRGEVPYVDFNLVIPPLAPWLYSVFLFCNSSILVFYLEQAILLTLFFAVLFRLLGNKTWIYLILLSIPFPIAMVSVMFPGYNFLLLFFLLLLIYCERTNKNDYLIGILLGCSFLTKQTVGGLLALASIYYLFVNYKKVLKRIVGFLLPVSLCFIILLLQGSFSSFLDLCFFGLFDFGHSNLHVDWFYFICFILAILVLIIRIIKKPKDICNYYVLLFASCVYPIIDYYHVSLFLAGFFILLLLDGSIQIEIYKHCIFFVIALSVIWFVIQNIYFDDLKIIHYPNFQFSLISERYNKVVQKLDQYLETLDDDVIYFLRGSENYFYKIKSNLDITYFDLPNYGNYGYNGTAKIISRLKKIEHGYVVIDTDAYESKDSAQQYVKEAVEYIMKRGEKVKTIGVYEVYHFE